MINTDRIIDATLKSSLMQIPNDENWEWWVESFTQKPVSAGETVLAFDELNNGWVWYGILSFSSDDMGFILRIETEAGKTLENDYTVSNLVGYGLINPCQGWWVSRSDDSNNLHYVIYTPTTFPGTPFKKLNFWVKNDGTGDGTVYAAAFVFIKVKQPSSKITPR